MTNPLEHNAVAALRRNQSLISVSVIVPAYNEEASIIELLRRVKQQNIPGISLEIIVVDDGSQDRTVELLEANNDLYTMLVKQERNGGKGAAVISGLQMATGDYILFQDADLEYDPNDYAKLFTPILCFDADIVMGSRMAAPQITRVSYFWHRVGNKIITLVFNILNNTTFTDIYSCYLLYRRASVDANDLRTRGWEQHAEILSLAKRRARRIYEVPVNYYGRSYDEGKKIRAHHAIGVLITIVVTRLFR